MKQIKLKYRINGAVFRRFYPRGAFRDAASRCAVLRDAGVEVEVRNFPKRVSVGGRP